MSRFEAAIELVLRELRGHRLAGGDAWRADSGSLRRLCSARVPVRANAVRSGNQPPSSAGADLPVQRRSSPVQHSQPAEVNPRGGNAAKISPDAVKEAATYELVTNPALSKAERLAQLRACPDRLPCAQCPYGRGPHEHVVFGVGNVDAEVMFIGEAPGAEEDLKGEPFVGRAGQLLNKIISTMGYAREAIYIANVLKCRPDTPGQAYGNRPPRSEEMESCRPCLFEQIDIIRPRVIVALGGIAMRGLLGLDAPMRDLRGRWHDFNGIPVMATYHPSYLLRNQAPSEKRKVWEDLLMVKERLGHEITERDRGYFLTKE